MAVDYRISDLIQFMHCICKNESKVLADSKIILADPEQNNGGRRMYCARRAQCFPSFWRRANSSWSIKIRLIARKQNHPSIMVALWSIIWSLTRKLLSSPHGALMNWRLWGEKARWNDTYDLARIDRWRRRMDVHSHCNRSVVYSFQQGSFYSPRKSRITYPISAMK